MQDRQPNWKNYSERKVPTNTGNTKEWNTKTRKENIERRLQQLENRAKTDPNIIWKARKKGRRKNELDYNLITEDDRVLTNPEETKTHVEEYFKDLYQARSSITEFEN